MRRRTKAREYALQMLYEVDLAHAEPEPTIQGFWAQHLVPLDVREFATSLVRGTIEHLNEIDRLIAAHTDNWNMSRMAVVDRNILRMGTYELLYLEDIPPKVSLNEAIELAKRFGDEESSKFVNGILDTVHKTHPRRPACSDPKAADRQDRPNHPPGSQTTSPLLPS